jgi:hypothetical protein
MSGIIDSSGVYVIGGLRAPYRGTVSLTSVAAGRKIELSINGGADYFVPQYDVEETGVIGLVIKAPITDIRFTGAEGDIWRSLV